MACYGHWTAKPQQGLGNWWRPKSRSLQCIVCMCVAYTKLSLLWMLLLSPWISKLQLKITYADRERIARLREMNPKEVVKKGKTKDGRACVSLGCKV